MLMIATQGKEHGLVLARNRKKTIVKIRQNPLLRFLSIILKGLWMETTFIKMTIT